MMTCLQDGMQEFLNEKFSTEVLQQRRHNVQQQSSPVATRVLANFFDKNVNDLLPVLGHWQLAHQQQQRLSGCHPAWQSALRKHNFYGKFIKKLTAVSTSCFSSGKKLCFNTFGLTSCLSTDKLFK